MKRSTFASAAVLVAIHAFAVGAPAALATTGVIAFDSDRCANADDHAQRGVPDYPIGLPIGPTGRCRTALWLVNDDGTNLRRLTDGGQGSIHGSDNMPAWSPDGNLLAYSSGGPDPSRIWVRTLAGVATPVSPQGTTGDADAAWLPDGIHLVFVSRRDTPGITAQHIFRIGIDGAGLQAITGSDMYDSSPSVAPGGSKVAFVRTNVGNIRMPGGVQTAALTVDPSNGSLTPLTEGQLPSRLIDLSYSPDGRYLALSAESGIYTMTADGRDIHQWTTQGLEVAWSPQGPTLFYLAPTGDSAAIAAIDLSQRGAAPRLLTGGNGSDANPSWHAFAGVASPPTPSDAVPPAVVLLSRVPGVSTTRAGQTPIRQARPGDALAFFAVDRTGIRRIDAVIARRDARGRCRFFNGRRFGRRRPCARPPVRRVRNTQAWQAQTDRLHPGSYEVFVRAIDTRGNGARRILRFRIRADQPAAQ